MVRVNTDNMCLLIILIRVIIVAWLDGIVSLFV